jgi:hypothetical protein
MKSTHRKIIAALILLAWLAPSRAESFQNSDLLSQRWKASWISCPEASRKEFGVFHFRKIFSLDSPPKRFVIHVSADNRYQLFVNGRRALKGPARGDLNHWRYESIDIAEHLRAGKNSLAAIVWNYAAHSPMPQMSFETALIIQGDGATEAAVNTDATWKVQPSQAIELLPVDMGKMRGYFVAGPGEKLDGSRHPWGWEQADYDDATWKPALTLTRGGPRGIRDSPSRWMLVERNIPLMEEKQERLARVVRAKGVEVADGFLQGQSPLTIPANASATILLDQSSLTTAYPELVTTGGRGSMIKLTYAESLRKGNDKGNRNETEGKEILGYEDRFLTDGGERRLFRPLWWRTFRYLQLDVQTDAEPLVIEDLRAIFTAYPFTLKAKFESDDPELEKIWEVGWRTARLCAHETYMDCPYYEQLQYVGDTRIQALVSLYMTGDDRLMKNAIELMDESRTPEGLTQSRYPSALPQYIPPFSLFWIGMMHDLWLHRGDQDFLRPFLGGQRGVLNWFEARLSPSGLLGNLEWWNFVDWTSDFKDGVPPQERDGQSSIISMQLAAALLESADLESAMGSKQIAEHYRSLAAKIIEAVRSSCWDSSKKLIADTPARRAFSQHANILAVLLDVVSVEDQQAVMKKVLADEKLTQCSYYFRFYLFRAMKKSGLGDEYLKQLKPWRRMLELGLTTWAEKPEPSRSDCHAWSAHPNFDLLATVAGIEPATSGFGEVKIEPHLGSLTRLIATFPHPLGDITVRYKRDGASLVADIQLPENLSGWFVWNGNKVKLRGGEQHIAF